MREASSYLDGQRVRQERSKGHGQMKITDKNKTKVDIPRYRFTWMKLLQR